MEEIIVFGAFVLSVAVILTDIREIFFPGTFFHSWGVMLQWQVIAAGLSACAISLIKLRE